ncbi:MAG: rhomboid family intramembrane serine protease [Acidimicrobiia bacterium]
MSSEPATSTVCYRHPDRPTGLSCTGCGRPICPECSTDAAVGQRCPDCLRQEGTQEVIPVGRARSQPFGRSSPTTFGIIAVAVGFYVIGFVMPAVGLVLLERLAMFNLAVAAGEWWRMFTVVLLHASPMHLLFNMWALYVFGPQIEREVGGLRFLALFLATAAAGSAFAFHLGELRDVGVGASGAIFGLFGVWLASAIRRRHTAYGRYLLNQLGFLLLINAALPLFIPRVSWQAHLGGLIAGFLVGQVWAGLGRSGATGRQLLVAVAVAVASVTSVLLLG